MAAQKNATYKVDNGTDFDEINFKTIASQVKLPDGTSLLDFLNGGGTIDGNLNIKGDVMIGTPSLAVNGFSKGANGILEQWGLVTITLGQMTITLPTPYKTRQFPPTLTVVDTAITDGVMVWAIGQNLTSLTIKVSKPCTVQWRTYGI